MNRQLSSVSSRNSSSKGYGLNGSEDEYDDVDLGNAGWLSASNNGDVQQWTLRIKSFRDLELQLPSNSMVSDLKERTKNALGERAQDRYMRLICKGRLLSPDDSAIQEFNVKDGDVIHAVLAQPQAPAQLKEQERRAKRDHGNTNTATIATIPTIPTIPGSNGSTAGSTLQRRQRRRGRGTVVGPGGRVTRVQPGENDDADDSWGSGSSDEEDTEMARERLGFDRLRGSGMSRSEITAIRTYFSRQVDRHIEELPNSHDEEPDLRRRRLLMGMYMFFCFCLVQVLCFVCLRNLLLIAFFFVSFFQRTIGWPFKVQLPSFD